MIKQQRYRYRQASHLRIGDGILLKTGEYLVIARIEASAKVDLALDFYDADDKLATTLDLDATVRILVKDKKKKIS